MRNRNIVAVFIISGCLIAQAGLVAHYKFDESNGSGTLYDSAGSADGTVNNVSFVTSGTSSGTFGNAGSFNGSTSYVQFGSGSHPSSFDLGTGDYSFVGWFKCETNTVDQNRLVFYCANKNSPTNPGWLFRIGRSGAGYHGQLMFNSDDGELRSNTAVDDGAWHFVAVVSSNGTLTMYLDGTTVVDTASVSGSATASASLQAYFGGNGGSDSYDGQLDEWRIYDSALNTDQLKLLWEKGITIPSLSLLTIE